MERSKRDFLNKLYAPLSDKCHRICSRFIGSAFPVTAAWYSGHYNKNADGQYQEDFFPIPLVQVEGLCDIEIDFEQISVSTKKRREEALAYDFQRLPLPFQVYGVGHFLTDYYLPGTTLAELRDNLRNSGEAEIGISFSFPFETEPEELFRFAAFLKQEGFYY